ncbi:hypothetical protein CROQUDRAFT_43419, partial [Cronartium quercuum f. sp. fusiforme G11]
QAFYYNKRRRPQDIIKEGDWVLIEAENRGKSSGKLQGGAHKLKEQYEGPYRVCRVLNEGQNVELELKVGDKTFNNFHISKIKIYHHQDGGREAAMEDTAEGNQLLDQK